VLNTAGQDISAALPFAIRGAAGITSVSPNPLDAGGPGVVMTVTGSGFVPESVLKWAGSPLGTTFVSPTQLTATITPALRALAGTFPVTVSDPAGGTSAGYPVTVSPVLFSLSPASAAALSPAITITATGAGFTPNSILRFNMFGLVTAYVNSTILTVVVPFEAFVVAGAAIVQVFDFAGTGRSLLQFFAIFGTTLIISQVSLAEVPVGAAATLTVTGGVLAYEVSGNGKVLTGTAFPLAADYYQGYRLELDQVFVCHGNREKHTLRVGFPDAMDAHLRHGDKIGLCRGDAPL